jgi:catechol 2,3-dioxygenase-like lactoylglutathione lyase family enzyme
MAAEMKLELIQVPVSDIDRAKDFYVNKVGFNDDHDHQFNEEIRFVQLTPPGSGCSIAMTTGPHAGEMEPGSIDGLQLTVEDANAVHDELAERGVEVSDVQDMPWGRFVFFSDPDGNKWSVQQIQYPGRPLP